MKLVPFIVLLAAFFFVAQASKSVSFCDDSFGNSCTPIGNSGAVVEEEEEVVLTFNSSISAMPDATPVLFASSQRRVKKQPQKPIIKPAVGNILLSDGRYALNYCV